MSSIDDGPSDFETLIRPVIDRRLFLKGGSAALGLFLAGSPLIKLLASDAEPGRSSLLNFTPVPASTADTFVVPSGYHARPLISWGDPLLPGAPAFDESGSRPAADQALQMGDNNDGMSLFPLSDNHALLVVNNEYSNLAQLFPHRGEAASADDVLKDHYAHGLSVLEIHRQPDGFWNYVPGAPLNRRITVRTETRFSGPVAGHPQLRTAMDPAGISCLGTFGNCANGQSPWGTYLACEENNSDYFAATAAFTPTPEQLRFGLSAADEYKRNWYLHDERFDLSKHPNEANRFGWVVEFDPHDPESVPVKRTALGRFSHENAALVINHDGRVVIYMGDDARGEHIYRFVSRDRYDPDDAGANRDLLDNGFLYAAQFSAQPGETRGQGRWLELKHGNTGLSAAEGFADQAEVLIHARLAATAVGATTMDRPEWIAVHPNNGSVLCTLTNNRNRGVNQNQPLDGANPRAGNQYGQIIRWQAPAGDHGSDVFDWDLFVLAGNPDVYQNSLYAGSATINADNMFNSPDGLSFDDDGRLWIRTDGDYSNTGDFAGMGNNQMLCADPQTGEIRRFATGPLGCEMTGVAFSADRRTLFVGVQHPGEGGTDSHFPAGGSSKPRSTIMMVRKDDAGIIGN